MAPPDFGTIGSESVFLNFYPILLGIILVIQANNPF